MIKTTAKEKPLVQVKGPLAIRRPVFKIAVFDILGTSVLCQHRFAQKVLDKLRGLPDPDTGELAPSKGKRKPKKIYSDEQLFNEARYVHKDGWDGFQCSAIRNACISACRLASFKMTIAKLSIFCIADGQDERQPEFGLVRIYGKPELKVSMGRVSTGEPYPIVRPIYMPWSAKVKIRFDTDQFNIEDISNLMTRVGIQVGVGEGRWDSKKTAGQGWGTFEVKEVTELN